MAKTPLAQEKFQEMPFTHGTEATLPPPVSQVVERAEHVRQSGLLQAPRVLQRPPAIQRHVRQLNTLPDYGWLVQNLRTKLGRLKFYPQMARVHKWEGKVVIQMKILDDGHLMDAAVEESSGY